MDRIQMAYNEKTGVFKNVAYVITNSDKAMHRIMSKGKNLEFRPGLFIKIEKSKPVVVSQKRAKELEMRKTLSFKPAFGAMSVKPEFLKKNFQAVAYPGSINDLFLINDQNMLNYQ
jgi:hypothetical protein